MTQSACAADSFLTAWHAREGTMYSNRHCVYIIHVEKKKNNTIIYRSVSTNYEYYNMIILSWLFQHIPLERFLILIINISFSLWHRFSPFGKSGRNSNVCVWRHSYVCENYRNILYHYNLLYRYCLSILTYTK